MQSNQFIVSFVLFSNLLAQVQGQIGGQAPLPGQPQVGFTQPNTQQWSNTGSQVASGNAQASWSRPAAAQPAWPQAAAQPTRPQSSGQQAWPQNSGQGRAPMAGQPQAGLTLPSQSQPTTAQSWSNAGVPQQAGANLQGSWASPQAASGVSQGVPQQQATNPQSPQGVLPQAANPQVSAVNGASVAAPVQTGSTETAPVNGAIQEIPIDNVGDMNSNGEISGTVPFNTTDEKIPSATPTPTQTSNASNNLWSLAIGILAIHHFFDFMLLQ